MSQISIWPLLKHDLVLGGKTLVGNHRGQTFLVVVHQVFTHLRRDFVPLLFADPLQVIKVSRLCRREHGLVHALGPGSGVGVFDASVPPQGGGSNRGGVNGLYLGVLLSYVVCELTGWWGGVVFPLLWGLVGRPGLPWALVWMGLGPPPWADLG